MVQPQVDSLIISINRNDVEYGKYGYPTILDNDQNFQGPIAGIISALNHVQKNHDNDVICQLLVSSCDTPNLPTNYVKKLNECLAQSNHLVAVVNDGIRNQNLHCLIRKEAWQSLIDFYEGGGRAMHRWYKKIGLLEVDFSKQADCFLNINSADQLI